MGKRAHQLALTTCFAKSLQARTRSPQVQNWTGLGSRNQVLSSEAIDSCTTCFAGLGLREIVCDPASVCHYPLAIIRVDTLTSGCRLQRRCVLLGQPLGLLAGADLGRYEWRFRVIWPSLVTKRLFTQFHWVLKSLGLQQDVGAVLPPSPPNVPKLDIFQ